MKQVTIWKDGNKTKAVLNTDGIIDSDARYIFRAGQCHALALAIIKFKPDWEIWALYDSKNSYNSPGHVVVRDKRNRFIDIEGTGAIRRWSQRFGKLKRVLVDKEQVKKFHHYHRPHIRAAIPFAKQLLNTLD